MRKNNLKGILIVNILIIIAINIITLVNWFYFRIYPLNVKIDNIKSDIISNEIFDSYYSYDELNKDINNIKKKYNIKFELKNIDDDFVGEEIKRNDLFLFNKLILIDEELYSINIYIDKGFNFFSIALELIMFQIIVIFITMVLMFVITNVKIINPMEIIINDIRSYKLGKRPVRKNLKGEFLIIQNEFVKLVDSIENEKSEQRRIIASISHDIKTPLTSIIGYSDIIDNNKLSISDIRKYNKKIHEKSLHIKNIVNSFDDYLANQNNQSLKLDDIFIKDIISDLINDYKIDLKNIGIEFVINNGCFNDDIIRVDILKLKRILSNIISNSIRHIDGCGLIVIDVLKMDECFKFTVKDNGSGVDKKIIDKVFDPLFTTDNSRKISGLGLSICKEFVNMHGGEIRGYNEDGFVVEFTIPF